MTFKSALQVIDKTLKVNYFELETNAPKQSMIEKTTIKEG